MTDNLPSLLEPEASGGDTAERGFSFQEQVALALIPDWLAYEGFAQLIREAMGDIEAQFFVPGHGIQNELIEVKNHRLAPSEFWKEIARFQEIDEGCPGDYRWFTLVSPGISDDLKPLINGLRRIRLPYGFYPPGSAVRNNSFAAYVKVVENLGRPDQVAQFLFEKVLIRPDWGLAQDDGEALFRQALADHLPAYENVSQRAVRDMYLGVGALVKKRRGEPITRRELETALRDAVPERQRPPFPSIHVHTVGSGEDSLDPRKLCFDWRAFFGGAMREYPAPSVWDEVLVEELLEARRWITHYRSTRNIHLTGSRRLSAAFALGSVFSAVAGFSIVMNHRGQLWSTQDYPAVNAPSYSPEVGSKDRPSSDLVVTVGIMRDIKPDVESALQGMQLDGSSRLDIAGREPIQSPEEVMMAVRAIKTIIADIVIRLQSQTVHLFYAGPSHLALLLGHHMNAIAPIQCYEWVSPSEYVCSCRLPT